MYLSFVENVWIPLMNQNVKHLISLLTRFFVLVKVSIPLYISFFYAYLIFIFLIIFPQQL